jgi:hypothetical protein
LPWKRRLGDKVLVKKVAWWRMGAEAEAEIEIEIAL